MSVFEKSTIFGVVLWPKCFDSAPLSILLTELVAFIKETSEEPCGRNTYMDTWSQEELFETQNRLKLNPTFSFSVCDLGFLMATELHHSVRFTRQMWICSMCLACNQHMIDILFLLGHLKWCPLNIQIWIFQSRRMPLHTSFKPCFLILFVPHYFHAPPFSSSKNYLPDTKPFRWFSVNHSLSFPPLLCLWPGRTCYQWWLS